MKKNSGMTLVEIIVVLGIMAILAVGAFAGFSRISYANNKKCANALFDEITRCRAYCMSHADRSYTYVYCGNDGSLYTYTTTATDEFTASQLNSKNLERISSSKVQLEYSTSSGSFTTLNSGEFLVFTFKLNGSFKTGAINSNAMINNANGSSFCKEVRLKRVDGDGNVADGDVCDIRMIQETGKLYMDVR